MAATKNVAEWLDEHRYELNTVDEAELIACVAADIMEAQAASTNTQSTAVLIESVRLLMCRVQEGYGDDITTMNPPPTDLVEAAQKVNKCLNAIKA